ncbi:hypothetical protein EDC04DRAFT_2679248 [Pisolithus marmoratus]|nr:hypothetical protein EDC04DRAFT_2679248 [Pisolithus marmoratus]
MDSCLWGPPIMELGSHHETTKTSRSSEDDTFEDVPRIHTFGFCGEALSSLCSLSDGLTFVTKTNSETSMGNFLKTDGNGRLKYQKTKLAR